MIYCLSSDLWTLSPRRWLCSRGTQIRATTPASTGRTLGRPTRGSVPRWGAGAGSPCQCATVGRSHGTATLNPTEVIQNISPLIVYRGSVCPTPPCLRPGRAGGAETTGRATPPPGAGRCTRPSRGTCRLPCTPCPPTNLPRR